MLTIPFMQHRFKVTFLGDNGAELPCRQQLQRELCSITQAPIFGAKSELFITFQDDSKNETLIACETLFKRSALGIMVENMDLSGTVLRKILYAVKPKHLVLSDLNYSSQEPVNFLATFSLFGPPQIQALR